MQEQQAAACTCPCFCLGSSNTSFLDVNVLGFNSASVCAHVILFDFLVSCCVSEDFFFGVVCECVHGCMS